MRQAVQAQIALHAAQAAARAAQPAHEQMADWKRCACISHSLAPTLVAPVIHAGMR